MLEEDDGAAGAGKGKKRAAPGSDPGTKETAASRKTRTRQHSATGSGQGTVQGSGPNSSSEPPTCLSPSVSEPPALTVQDLPPPPRFKLPRGKSWSQGITEETNVAYLPPRRYSDDVPLSEVDERDIQAIQLNNLRSAGLAQTFLTLKHKFVTTSAELRKVKDEVEVLKAEAQTSQSRHAKTQEELLMTREALEKANSEIVMLEKIRAADVRALEVARGEQDALKADRDDASAQLVEAKGKISEFMAVLKGAAGEAFQSALDQIRHLNPGVELNLAGFHYRSRFTDDGQFVPHPPSPAEPSLSRMEDDPVEGGEEASTSR